MSKRTEFTMLFRHWRNLLTNPKPAKGHMHTNIHADVPRSSWSFQWINPCVGDSSSCWHITGGWRCLYVRAPEHRLIRTSPIERNVKASSNKPCCYGILKVFWGKSKPAVTFWNVLWETLSMLYYQVQVCSTRSEKWSQIIWMVIWWLAAVQLINPPSHVNKWDVSQT